MCGTNHMGMVVVELQADGAKHAVILEHPCNPTFA
jgi:hypothetical protein